MRTSTPFTMGFAMMALLASLCSGAAPVQAQDGSPTGAQIEDRSLRTLQNETRERVKAALERGAPAPSRAVTPIPRKMTGGFTCIPSCNTAQGDFFTEPDFMDVKFLGIAGENLITLSDPSMEVRVAVPAGASSFTIGLFDGDAGRGAATGAVRWDSVSSTELDFSYTLLADPLGDGTGTTVVDLVPGQPSVSSLTMPDNDWIDFTVSTDAGAQSPSGNFFYRLLIESPATGAENAINVFKIRTSGVVSIELANQPFSYLASGTSNDDPIVFPNFPNSTTPSAYDGEWSFFFDVPTSQAALELWDGDFDHGDGAWNNFLNQDTDDPNTPNALPPFPTTSDACPEEIAQDSGTCGVIGSGTGQPPDNIEDPNGAFPILVRGPTIRYDLVFPDGQSFPNENPSGNQEWELFRISTAATLDPAVDDHITTSIPAGAYELRIEGADYINLNALRLPFRLLCVDETGAPCVALRPFQVGDTVFSDDNGNGIQDPGEPGISGVLVELFDAAGGLLGEATTDVNGHYAFEVEAGGYTATVAASNFAPGGTLEGLSSTTGDSASGTVVDDNVLTLDLGYAASTASIGDFVWYDANLDGLQDEPPASGLANVTVNLLDASSILVASAVTDANGAYLFSGLAPGTYTVDVDDLTLPVGIDQNTTGNDPLVVNLTAGEIFLGADFGYVAGGDNTIQGLGDRVWNDADGNGAPDDLSEPGIDGVVVTLEGDVDGDGLADVFDSTTTATFFGTAGIYGFNDLAPGTYVVSVDPSSLPATITGPTYDFDGVSTPNVVTITLAGSDTGTTIDVVDFGYDGTLGNTLGTIGDRVWSDVNGNGVQDGGEPGIPGVGLTLFDSAAIPIDFAVTGAGGNYSFTDLASDFYFVIVDDSTLPAGAVGTFDIEPPVGDHFASLFLNTGETRDDVDFGYQLPGGADDASIGDRVWLDLDGDGLEGALEPGIAGVTVNLLDGASALVASQVTSGTGGYLFTGLAAGTYTVQVDISTLPAGVVQTHDLDGTLDDETTVSLAASQALLDADFGYQGTGSVGDLVFVDLDADGVQGAGESGIAGVTLELLDAAATVIATTVSDAAGVYGFGGLPAGTFTVRVDASTLPLGANPASDLDGTLDNQTTVTLTAGQSRADLDFGYNGAGMIGDTVFLDLDADGVEDLGDPGIAGVTVELRDGVGNTLGTQVTDTAGFYAFGNLLPGDYTVLVDVSTLPAGVVQTADPDATLDDQHSLTLGDGENRETVDFGYAGTGSLGDRVWRDDSADGVQDGGEPGLNGLTIELLQGASVIATVVTAGDGNYTFANLTADTYTVRVATPPAGLVQTFDLDGLLNDQTTVVLGPGEARVDLDFGYAEPRGSIGDRVWRDDDLDGIEDGGEPGLNGVTVELLDASSVVIATAVTAGDGNYTFAELAAGSYTVRVIQPPATVQTFDLDGTLDNQTGVSLAAGEDRTDVDFGYAILGSIGDRVWNDADGDGVQDGGEVGLNGVTVQLLDPADVVLASAITAGDGNYTFGDLAAGVYTVAVLVSTLPPDLVQTFDLDGLTTPHEATLTLGSGVDRTDVDFGYGACGDCEGKVTTLTFQYIGSVSGIDVVIDGKRGKKKQDEVFSGVLNPGDVFTIVGPETGNPGFFGTLGTEIKIFVNGDLNAQIHTSCSQPIGPGLVDGDFKILAGASKLGGLLCPLGGGGDCQASATAPSVAGSTLSWPISNDGTSVLTLIEGGFSWPAANGALTEVRLGGTTIFSGLRSATQTTITETQWQVAASGRQIPAGAIENLELVFSGPAEADVELYTLSASFEGGCAVDHSPTIGSGEGCTPGYWMQDHHFDSWVGHGQGDSFNSVFGVSASGSPSLLDALKKGGGGFKALGRHATAALLNSTNSGVNYAFTTSQVISLVQSAYASGDPEPIKDQLEVENERGCPLN